MANSFADRYSRNVFLKEIGEDCQKKLANCNAVVIGVGALGSIIANNLARAGVGKITMADRDFVEPSNLQRQMLFNESDVGKPKAIAAGEALKKINSDIEYFPILKDVNFSNVESIIRGADVVIDGTDNMETRYLINDACVKNKIPWIYGGAVGTYGMTMNIIPGKTPCFRCLIPTIPSAGSLPTCDTAGVLAAIAVVIGSIESVEAIKIMLGKEEINRNLLTYDIWEHEFKPIKIPRNRKCICCGVNDFEFLNIRKRAIVTTLCGTDTVQITPIQKGEITLPDLARRLQKSGTVLLTGFALVFKLPSYEITIFRDGRALIKGTGDEKKAKSLYAKYIGT